MSDAAHEMILHHVCQLIAQVSGNDPGQLGRQTALIGDLNLDSLALYEIVIDLEERFSLQISDEDIDRIRIIDDIVKTIARKLAARQGSGE